jgi:hypothetical protein
VFGLQRNAERAARRMPCQVAQRQPRIGQPPRAAALAAAQVEDDQRRVHRRQVPLRAAGFGPRRHAAVGNEELVADAQQLVGVGAAGRPLVAQLEGVGVAQRDAAGAFIVRLFGAVEHTAIGGRQHVAVEVAARFGPGFAFQLPIWRPALQPQPGPARDREQVAAGQLRQAMRPGRHDAAHGDLETFADLLPDADALGALGSRRGTGLAPGQRQPPRFAG